ncbi:MAG: hypothetical protein D6750_04745, partial [Bacteroidetes bacterium]
MLRAYRFAPYTQKKWESLQELNADELKDYLWIDVCGVKREELKYIERPFGLRFPSKQQVEEIETSSRYHEENGSTLLIMRLIEIQPENEGLALYEQDLSLIWQQDRVFTYREQESRVFQELVRRLKNNTETVDSSLKLFLAILGQIVDTDADNIELISQYIYRLSNRLREADHAAQQRIILQTQKLQEFLIRLREGLFDIQRVLSLLIRSQRLSDPHREIVRILLKDISSLIDHNNFSFQRLESLQNTILSLINLEQNRIIKIFTVITVVF